MLEDFRGRGWPFPIKLGQNKRLSLLDGNEKIRQSIFLILSTASQYFLHEFAIFF